MRLPRNLDLHACLQAFAKYCADELVDPRTRDLLEEAFIAGFVAGAAQPVVSSMETAAVGDSPRLGETGASQGAPF